MTAGLRGGALRVAPPGEPVELAAGVVRVTAPNPSLMTGPGTNTYLVGRSEVIAIDPGPDDPAHLAALTRALGRARLRAVAVTHSHPDHAPGAWTLAEDAGVPVLGFARPVAGPAPDRALADGDVVACGDIPLRALHTPGHSSDHLCYAVREPLRLLFSGDHVMGGSTVVIAPPDGDMAAYLASLGRLAAELPPFDAIAPGHGPVLDDPATVLSGYVSHRLDRERAIELALASRDDPLTVGEIVEAVYTDVAPELHPVARYSVWAHLRKLSSEGRAASERPDDPDGCWTAS